MSACNINIFHTANLYTPPAFSIPPKYKKESVTGDQEIKPSQKSFFGGLSQLLEKWIIF